MTPVTKSGNLIDYSAGLAATLPCAVGHLQPLCPRHPVPADVQEDQQPVLHQDGGEQHKLEFSPIRYLIRFIE